MMSKPRGLRAFFEKAWVRNSKPSLMVVNPVSTWVLPAGYAYDEATDTVRHETSGAVLTGQEVYWNTSTVPYVSQRASEELQALMIAGVLPAGSIEVAVRAESAAAVRESHLVLVNGKRYNVRQTPGGADETETVVRIRLERRE